MKRVTKANLAALRGKIVSLRHSGLSLPAIGRIVQRDHTTVHYHLAEAGVVLMPKEWSQWLVRRGAGL